MTTGASASGSKTLDAAPVWVSSGGGLESERLKGRHAKDREIQLSRDAWLALAPMREADRLHLRGLETGLACDSYQRVRLDAAPECLLELLSQDEGHAGAGGALSDSIARVNTCWNNWGARRWGGRNTTTTPLASGAVSSASVHPRR